MTARDRTSLCPQQALCKWPFLIHPLNFGIESRAIGHGPDLCRPKFVAALRPNRFAVFQFNGSVAVNENSLINDGPEVHFDPLFRFVISRFVTESAQVEIGPKLAIDPLEQV